jgi:hypothetical protein
VVVVSLTEETDTPKHESEEEQHHRCRGTNQIQRRGATLQAFEEGTGLRLAGALHQRKVIGHGLLLLLLLHRGQSAGVCACAGAAGRFREYATKHRNMHANVLHCVEFLV